MSLRPSTWCPSPRGLLRAHVGRRAQNLAIQRHGHLARLPLGQAEIHQTGPALVVDHDVRGLDVAVDDAAPVGVLQRIGHLGNQTGRLTRGRPTARQEVRQGQAPDEVADQIGQALMLANLVHRHDPRVAQLRDTAGLAQEAIPILIRGQVAGAGTLIATTRSSSASRAL